MERYVTACPRNCYSTCSFYVYTENGKVINVEPNPNFKATPEGICLKGLSYVERANSPDRIIYPHKKNSDGTFSRITWDEALNTIADKLQYFKKEFGQQSVLFYAASGMSGLLNDLSIKFWREIYGGATTVYGNLCWPAGLEATRLTLGENKHNVPWDLENAKLIVLWGKNSAESNIQEMIPLGKSLDNGGKLIVIDPRRTESTQRAELLVQPLPATDGALALSIANLLIANDWIDHDFISKHVYGFEDFKNSIQHCTTEWASAITGVPKDFIDKMAWMIGNIKPMTLIPGYGMQRYTNSGQTIRCLLTLSILTGNIGKPGACWHYANLQSYVFDDLLEPLCYYPPQKPDGIIRRSISTAKLGEDMLSQSNPPLKMIWVERGNPISQNPDTNKVLKAFKALDFRVVVEQFFTDTALEADIVLPAKNMFEQTDIIGSYWNPYVQLRQKVVEPAGEVKPETEIYYLLALKLGFTREQIDNILLPLGDEAINKFLSKKMESFPALSIEKLKTEPILAPNLQDIAFSDYNFRTPSGKIEIKSIEAQDRWGVNPLPTFEKAREADINFNKKYPFYLMSPNTKNRIHSQFNNLKIIKMISGEPVIQINFKDAKGRGILDGDLVKVFNERGELVIKAELTFQVRIGCVVIPNGWWRSQGGAVNILSKGRETDMGFGSAFHDNKVQIEKFKL
ncbi:MAG: molybdopterin-dependent oxidoreductase [Bacteroidales bacterium]|nr:molybdopterin-dependent oxidoreductase [Bacteroidales bacterium]